jgi:hypothetical protein
MPLLITYPEPNRISRRLRQHDLAGLRCLRHDSAPKVASTAKGLTVVVCCQALDDAVRQVLRTSRR